MYDDEEVEITSNRTVFVGIMVKESTKAKFLKKKPKGITHDDFINLLMSKDK